uniref:Hedgehog protein n=1 Tax=Terebratalia transversa TaxID=34513 RepID=A0A0U2KU40_TERTR|nr:hedgehog [Terebratalia transversa]
MELTVIKLINTGVLIFLILTEPVVMCGPGPGANWGRRRPHKRTPLVFKQHIPNVSENVIGASGSSDGRISRDSKKFKDLAVNYNSDIKFKDEEGTGADRIMSTRCKDKLNILAISVMNQWPGVKLRVTEAWDENGSHAKDSLHYEGRAVDITTSDKDRTKYGMLARLAVESGFDWVFFQSRSHVHVSVRSDSSAAIKSGGCFDGKSLVQLENGATKTMDQLTMGDKVLAVDDTGHFVYSDVIMFLDKNANKSLPFYTIYTDNGDISLTSTHLIYASNTKKNTIGADMATFARRVQKGQYVYLKDTTGDFVTARRVTKVKVTTRNGVYAPLTKHGTIVVNNIVASCYGIIENVNIAHMAFSPVRIFYDIRNNLPLLTNSPANTLDTQHGIHWYPDMLFRIAPYFIDSRLLETV